MRRILCVVLLATLTACAQTSVSGSSPDDPGVLPAAYEDIIKAYLDRTLKDPYSVRDLTISQPVQRSLWLGLVGGGSVQAYVTCVSFNAKNSYGAYVGRRSYTMAFKDAVFVRDFTGATLFQEGC